MVMLRAHLDHVQAFAVARRIWWVQAHAIAMQIVRNMMTVVMIT